MIEASGIFVGIFGGVLTIVSIVLIWRKNLLNFGISTFQNVYRTEMDDFKKTIRDYVNKNDERHTATLNRIVNIYEKTHNEVLKQTHQCKLIQVQKTGEHRVDESWRKHIEGEMQQIKQDVTEIKKHLNTAEKL